MPTVPTIPPLLDPETGLPYPLATLLLCLCPGRSYDDQELLRWLSGGVETVGAAHLLRVLRGPNPGVWPWAGPALNLLGARDLREFEVP